ncbi:SWIRM-domain-containing protein [Delitschia confertaspora ATCC 74209]|uniref:SWIRM-domain-containing protein n=1 Tax=Delitschia confertaspora ATCC 74209 TaxID=1513339 RepID=A0A9P4JUD1_9PLEO|nr:SWIRM-domain-containing protein [Delitschia confertaspora ATCC 74209]
MADHSPAGETSTKGAESSHLGEEGTAQSNVSGGQADQDMYMGDDHNTGDVKPQLSSREQSAATPAVADNPLDAPDAPRPEAEDADGQADEEMTGVIDAAKSADGEMAKTADGAPAEPDDEAKGLLVDAARKQLVQQQYMVIVPSYSQWFDMHTIDIKEKRALPEFFNGRNRSKTPAVYKDYRDFMINTYRMNPLEYLTVTACRRNLAGDVCAIMRVHAFLEQWGLINYQVDPEIRPSNIGPPFTGHFRLTADTPRGLQPLQPAPGSTTDGKPHPQTEKLANQQALSKTDLNQKTRRDIYDTEGREATMPESGEAGANGEARGPIDHIKQYHCHSCGNDCTRIRHHLSASKVAANKPNPLPNHDLCPRCFMEGSFPVSYSASDYIRVENPSYKAVPDRTRPWTEEETLNLLEALEVYDEDWNKVAEHVPGRTREECLQKFLKLDIDERYLEEDLPQQESGLGLLSNGPIPFSQADNPVLSVLSYLVSLADPHVTAAAAGRSIQEQIRTLRKNMEKSPTRSEAEKGKGATPKDTSDVKNEDAMDVDNRFSPQPTDNNQVATTTSTSQDTSNPVANLPFALTAARSSALASHEERHITRLVSGAVNMQLQKLQLKLAQFNDFENLLSAERRDLERRRQQLFLDRLAFQKRVRGLEETCRRVSQGLGGQPGLPGGMGAEDAVAALTEGMRMFGVGKGEEKGVMRREGEGEDAAPVEEGQEGFGRVEL